MILLSEFIVEIADRIDLNHLNSILPKSIFEPEQFPAIIMKTPMNTTCLIFSTGKIVITGAKEKQDLINTTSYLKEITNF